LTLGTRRVSGEPEEEIVRLRRSSMSSAGLRRQRRGRGFSYLTADGRRLDDEETLERINSLAIPPAWREVWICPHPNGHIQAVGTDDAGRRQYRYHDQWRQERDEEKHDRVLTMAGRLPQWRAAVQEDLGGRGLGYRRVVAAALRMLDLGIFRTGGEEYASEHGTRGVATLLREHTSVRGEETTFEYPAKGGAHRAVVLHDASLAKTVKSLLRAKTGDERLLCYRDGKQWKRLHADDVNARFKELAGDDCSAKDLRTWTATVLAATAFASAEPPKSQTAASRQERKVIRQVAEALGNTPGVCRSSYVDPRTITAFREGRTISAALARADRLGDDEARAALERATIRLLRQKR
jgi:DNA topoisomerase IB